MRQPSTYQEMMDMMNDSIKMFNRNIKSFNKGFRGDEDVLSCIEHIEWHTDRLDSLLGKLKDEMDNLDKEEL